jgi:hypothetical protein
MAWAMPKYFICLSSVKDQAVLSYFYPHSDWTLLEYSTAAEDQGALQIQRVARKQVDSTEQTTQWVQLP